MMTRIQVRLLRPLNGAEIGSLAEYDQADAERLAACGAVEIIAAKQAAAPKNKAAKQAAAPKNKKALPPANKAGLADNAGANP